uniref:Fanconi-associated nuclease n=1 Tax=Syphacia muris TaxID=451379 RepID=A0A158R4T1_9BILA
MALEAAFRKQLSKQKCIVCGEMIPFGIYSRHLNNCITDPDDEECKVVQILTAEDKQRIAILNTVTLDDSSCSVKENCGLSHTEGSLSLSSDANVNGTCSAETATTATFHVLITESESNTAAKIEGTDSNKLLSLPTKVEKAASESHVTKIESCKNELAEKSKSLNRKRTSKTNFGENNKKKSLVGTSNRNECCKKIPMTASVKLEKDIPLHRSIKKEKFEFPNETKSDTLLMAEAKKLTDAYTLEQVVEEFSDYFKACNFDISGAWEVSPDNMEQIPSPYYLVFFNYIFKKVFEADVNGVEKQRLVSFWGNELRYFHRFILLSSSSKQLFVRLVLRRYNWLPIGRLKYENIAEDLIPLLDELVASGLVETSETYPFKLEDAMRLLEAPSLKNVAKTFKLDYTLPKEEIIQKLLNLSNQKNVFGLPISGQIFKIVRREMGKRYRINQEALRFVLSVFTLFSPIDMDSVSLLDQPTLNLGAQLLFVMLQLRIKKIRFPAPTSLTTLNIYNDRPLLYGYVEAKLMESEIAYLMQKNLWNEVHQLATKSKALFSESYCRYKDLIEILPPYLRRFTDCWVYARCISHGVEAYQRLRKYEDAVKLLRCLLFEREYKMFLINTRGMWWDRLALNLDSHLKNKMESFEAIKLGTNDSALGEKDILQLQMRGEKLNKMWKGPLNIPLPQRTDITGVTLGKVLGDQRVNCFTTERNGQFYKCSVEEVALDYYIKNEGFNEGVHAEGGIWHFIYGLLFYDIIFDDTVKNVWFSETQINPADLNSKSFYLERKAKFDARFVKLENGVMEDFVQQINTIYEKHYGETNSEMSWECFTDFEQVQRFMLCCEPRMLAAIFRRMTMDYRNCRSGFPDLTVWNSSTKKLAVIEVKGPNDRLSSKQILWLHYFKEQNVRSEVCYVAGRLIHERFDFQWGSWPCRW